MEVLLCVYSTQNTTLSLCYPGSNLSSSNYLLCDWGKSLKSPSLYLPTYKVRIVHIVLVKIKWVKRVLNDTSLLLNKNNMKKNIYLNLRISYGIKMLICWFSSMTNHHLPISYTNDAAFFVSSILFFSWRITCFPLCVAAGTFLATIPPQAFLLPYGGAHDQNEPIRVFSEMGYESWERKIPLSLELRDIRITQARDAFSHLECLWKIEENTDQCQCMSWETERWQEKAKKSNTAWWAPKSWLD